MSTHSISKSTANKGPTAAGPTAPAAADGPDVVLVVVGSLAEGISGGFVYDQDVHKSMKAFG